MSPSSPPPHSGSSTTSSSNQSHPLPHSGSPVTRITHPHGHHLRASADLSSFHSPLSGRNNRPTSEIFLGQGIRNNATAETDQLDAWERDLQHYEATLESMATASLDSSFKEELGAIEQWFRVLSEAERTAALYSLLQQASAVQVRFFVTVLKGMAGRSGVGELLSPGVGSEKESMQQKLNSALTQLSLSNKDSPPTPSLRPGTASSHHQSTSPRNSRHLDPSTIQAMFPDAAAAISHQRSLLNANRNSINGGISRSPGLPPPSTKEVWMGSPNSVKSRPKSADWGPEAISNQRDPAMSTSLRSPNVGITQPGNFQPPSVLSPTGQTITDDLNSPFGGPAGGSWASMVNTPVVPMFPNPHTTGNKYDISAANEELSNAATMKLAAWNVGSNRGGVILDSDVRKFRRQPRVDQGQGSPQRGTVGNGLRSQPQTHQGVNLGQLNQTGTNILMYDERGQFVSLPTPGLRGFTSPLASGLRNTIANSRPSSPYLQGGFSGGVLGTPTQQNSGFLTAFDGLASPHESFGQGYLSDHSSDGRRGGSPMEFGRMKYGANLNSVGSRRGGMNSHSNKPQEDPLDPHLLQDIPAWLRSLRLHKYTDNFSDVRGGVRSLCGMDEAELERRGVSAVGARRKLLKCFEQVRAGLSLDSAEGGPRDPARLAASAGV